RRGRHGGEIRGPVPGRLPHSARPPDGPGRPRRAAQHRPRRAPAPQRSAHRPRLVAHTVAPVPVRHGARCPGEGAGAHVFRRTRPRPPGAVGRRVASFRRKRATVRARERPPILGKPYPGTGARDRPPHAPPRYPPPGAAVSPLPVAPPGTGRRPGTAACLRAPPPRPRRPVTAPIRVGTRRSPLARIQTDHVLQYLRRGTPTRRFVPTPIDTSGDRDRGPGGSTDYTD